MEWKEGIAYGISNFGLSRLFELPPSVNPLGSYFVSLSFFFFFFKREWSKGLAMSSSIIAGLFDPLLVSFGRIILRPSGSWPEAWIYIMNFNQTLNKLFPNDLFSFWIWSCSVTKNESHTFNTLIIFWLVLLASAFKLVASFTGSWLKFWNIDTISFVSMKARYFSFIFSSFVNFTNEFVDSSYWPCRNKNMSSTIWFEEKIEPNLWKYSVK